MTAYEALIAAFADKGGGTPCDEADDALTQIAGYVEIDEPRISGVIMELCFLQDVIGKAVEYLKAENGR